MASNVGQVPPPAATKYDALVAEQLARAESRIRLLDLTAGLLGFAALTLAYVVVMVLCDSKLVLSAQTRQASLYLYLAASAVYLFFAIVRPLRMRVNPYYAARQVERQLPHAKNSIVNWVDLHSQPLPPAIRGALGRRAAKDLAEVDLDRAISGRRAAWMGGIAGLVAAVFIASFFLLGPSPFLSLLKRAFNPFGSGGVSTRTQLTLVKPEGGNTTVTVGRGVNFVVEVHGKMPDPRAADAVKLLYRYEEGDPWLERLLIQEPSHEWTTSLSALEVKNGFWYRITGGDASTEEYRVNVRAAPAITDFLATYHFRPYVARADEVRHERDLKELRGTEVVLRIRTNRTLQKGQMQFEGKDSPHAVPAQVAADDPHVLLVRFVLEEDGKYRLYFTSTDGEGYTDAVSHLITVIPDNPPTVELTKPGEDIRLPADALLQLEGKAGDDIGVKDLMLRMKVAGAKLRGQPYRGGDKLRLADGGYPREVEYRDFVELSRVQSEDGKPFALRAGMELEYWLEASDACDYPQPHVAESKHYRVLLTEPEKNEAKRQQEKQQAEKNKKSHEQQQDKQLQQENQDRQQQRQAQEARNKEEENKSKEAAGEQSQEKQDQQEGNGAENKDNKDGQGGENKDGQGENKDGQGENKGLSKEEQATEDQIKKALQEKQEKEDAKGEGKPEKSEQGEGKGAQQEKSDGGDAAGQKSEGENKDAGQQDAKQAGEGKDKGKPQEGGDASPSDGKGDKQAASKPEDRSEGKAGEPMNQPGNGEAGEGKGKPETAPPSGEGKPSGAEQASKDAGEGKPQPMGSKAEAAAGDSKPADGKDQQAQREGAGEAKDNGGQRGEAKNEGAGKDEDRTEAKKGAGAAAQGDRADAGEPKPSGDKGASEEMAKGESKPDAAQQARNATKKDIEDLARSLESQDRQKREEARRQLEKIEKDAADPDAREQAAEALEKKGQPEGAGNGGSQQPEKGSSNDSKEEPKKGDGDGSKGDGSKGDGSASSQEGSSGKGSGEKEGDGGKQGKGSGGDGKTPNARSSQGSSEAGGGGKSRSGHGDGGGKGQGAPPPNKPNAPRDHRAAQMQLEDFAKRVNKDVLKDAGVSEAAWKKYLEARRKQLTPRETPRPETPNAPQQATNLPSMGGRTSQPAAAGSSDVQAGDRGQPPPGYRDAFREFTRQMNKTK